MPAQRSTDNEVAYLRGMGFVNVTGLTARKANHWYTIGENIGRQTGTYTKGNVTSIITEHGEVWIAFGSNILPNATPTHKEVLVPCSCGETILVEHILARMRDPYAEV